MDSVLPVHHVHPPGARVAQSVAAHHHSGRLQYADAVPQPLGHPDHHEQHCGHVSLVLCVHSSGDLASFPPLQQATQV